MTRRAERKWRAAAREHEAAIAAFLLAAEQASGDAWTSPRAPGKWSPAQVSEHLVLAYEALLRELGGGGAMVPRLPPVRQRLLRWILLPHILFHRGFPRGARAPRETRPPETVASREEILGRLRERADHFQRDLADARKMGSGRLTHPYFGTISPLRALRLCAIHLEHHRRQLLNG